MRTSGRASLLCLLTAFALAGAGCDDRATEPTAPEAAHAAVTPTRGLGKAQRTPYIAELAFPYGTTVDLGDGDALGYHITLANPGPKTATGLFITSFLEQNGLVEEVGSIFIFCYDPDGALPPRAPCTLYWSIFAERPTQFQEGPAVFTLKLMQRTIDNQIKELDRATMDVVIDL